jgi:predicted enzyme related to lactoylglutathione lyase
VAASAAIEGAGGTIVEPADPSVVDIVGAFRDPAGNLLGIHQYNPDNAAPEAQSA